MVDSERLRDYILGRAFKAVRFDSNTRRLAPEYALRAYENEEIEDIACRQYGYSCEEYVRFKQKVLTSRAVNTSAESGLTLPEIGNGDILEITGPSEETLRLMKLQGADFLVLADDTLDSRPGDVMTMLQYSLRVDAPALMQLHRGAAIFPSRDKAYSVGRVCALRTMRSDAALYDGYLKSESEQTVSQFTCSKSYASGFDLGFNGFAGPMLAAEPGGRLYEIDLGRMTYRVNPAFDPASWRGGRAALLQELSAGFCIEEASDDFSSIVMVEEGALKLSARDGYYILTCERQATISLC